MNINIWIVFLSEGDRGQETLGKVVNVDFSFCCVEVNLCIEHFKINIDTILLLKINKNMEKIIAKSHSYQI